ncbi:MAG TPA: OPT/YSL family transporter [Phycisphaerae bacterium]|nr:OPT/YSL family transporter [Phycisphaerae bacterium]HRR86858.1 OPT/YSL family transporter [Phycisphaerae bacterium]
MREDRELAEFRGIMPPPDSWESGFNLKSVFAALFIGTVMMPGSMYMGLIAGAGLGPAAQWVTVILFMEIARRAFSTMKSPEVFVLYYMAGAAITLPYTGLLWNQFLVQSDAAEATGLTRQFPTWFAPTEDVLKQRTFFHWGWAPAITLVALQQLFTRIERFGLGYILFRITSDVEKLPFPMAPVGAAGIVALAETSTGQRSWRWRVFSIGSVIGLAFGFVYVGIPAVSGTLLLEPIQPLEIPWTDLTWRTETVLPAVPTGISFDLGHYILGMVLPLWAVVGEFIGMLLTMIANPILHRAGVLTWSPGSGTIGTQFSNSLDFYFSFGIGVTFAIALIGFYHLFRSMRHRDGDSSRPDWRRLFRPPEGRGDISLWVAVAIWVGSTLTYISLCRFWLIPDFPLWILLAYGFLYTPIVSYVSARMEGVVGQYVDIPLVREAAFILSGYQKIDVWFAPIPLTNDSGNVVYFRQVELTGTRIRSVLKAELVILPIVLVAGVLFSQFIWRLAPIPSPVYPFTQKMWELQAYNMCLTYSATTEGGGLFARAFQPTYVLAGTGISVAAYAFMARFGLPVMLAYGLIRGMGGGMLPHFVIPHFVGAMIGHYFFRRRFGLQWRQYAPVLMAGFGCGMGLIGMLALGFVLVSKSVFPLPY